MSNSRKPSPVVSPSGSWQQSGIKRSPTSTPWSAPLPTFSGGMRTWRASWRASRRSVELWYRAVFWLSHKHFHGWQITQCSLHVSPQNEEVLKKCAQDYLMRIKQEEQRYQTLKVHAEEKLDKWATVSAVHRHMFYIISHLYCLLPYLSNRANEEIAQVRAKANSESVALNASLRKEQMRVESLERAVLQKVRLTAKKD